MENFSYDRGQRLWLFKFIVNVYRKALGCVRNAKGKVRKNCREQGIWKTLLNA